MVSFCIKNTSIVEDGDEGLVDGYFQSITFTNGNATKTWSDVRFWSENPGGGDTVVGSDGLSFTPINSGTAYEVAKGTATASAIVIPSVYNGLPVTAIANGGFSQSTTVTSVTIPNSVTSIGSYAFEGCTGLTSITIGNGVTSIGSDAFLDCTSLTSITIPAGVTSIGSGAFVRCSGLTSINVASGNTVYRSEGNCLIRIADNTLILGCKNSVIPASVTSIGSWAFGGCTGLPSVTIPARVTRIGRYAFGGCTGLASVTIPASVTSIDSYAFDRCTGLTSVTFATGSNITSDYFGSSAFPQGTSVQGGDNLRTAYLAGGAGTYTRTANGSSWTKQ
jgi:hypothetical protein